MPSIKISQPAAVPDGHGLPLSAQDRILHLNDAHLSTVTLSLLEKAVTDAHAGADLFDAGLLASRQVRRSAGMASDGLLVDFSALSDGAAGIGIVPKDLLECVLYAASYGFNAILFECAHPDDLPYCNKLPALAPYQD